MSGCELVASDGGGGSYGGSSRRRKRESAHGVAAAASALLPEERSPTGMVPRKKARTMFEHNSIELPSHDDSSSSSNHSMPEYSVTFDTSKPLGVYCFDSSSSTTTTTTRRVCQVLSVCPNSQAARHGDRLSAGTIVLESRVEGSHDFNLVSSCIDLQMQCNAACGRKLHVTFVNNATEQQQRRDDKNGTVACTRNTTDCWASTGQWQGKYHAFGWNGIPKLAQKSIIQSTAQMVESNQNGSAAAKAAKAESGGGGSHRKENAWSRVGTKEKKRQSSFGAAAVAEMDPSRSPVLRAAASATAAAPRTKKLVHFAPANELVEVRVFDSTRRASRFGTTAATGSLLHDSSAAAAVTSELLPRQPTVVATTTKAPVASAATNQDFSTANQVVAATNQQSGSWSTTPVDVGKPSDWRTLDFGALQQVLTTQGGAQEESASLATGESTTPSRSQAAASERGVSDGMLKDIATVALYGHCNDLIACLESGALVDLQSPRQLQRIEADVAQAIKVAACGEHKVQLDLKRRVLSIYADALTVSLEVGSEKCWEISVDSVGNKGLYGVNHVSPGSRFTGSVVLVDKRSNKVTPLGDLPAVPFSNEVSLKDEGDGAELSLFRVDYNAANVLDLSLDIKFQMISPPRPSVSLGRITCQMSVLQALSSSQVGWQEFTMEATSPGGLLRRARATLRARQRAPTLPHSKALREATVSNVESVLARIALFNCQRDSSIAFLGYDIITGGGALLHTAVSLTDESLVKKLLQNGANPFVESRNGTALSLAMAVQDALPDVASLGDAEAESQFQKLRAISNNLRRHMSAGCEAYENVQYDMHLVDCDEVSLVASLAPSATNMHNVTAIEQEQRDSIVPSADKENESYHEARGYSAETDSTKHGQESDKAIIAGDISQRTSDVNQRIHYEEAVGKETFGPGFSESGAKLDASRHVIGQKSLLTAVELLMPTWLESSNTKRYTCRFWGQTHHCRYGRLCNFIHVQRPFGDQLGELWEQIENKDLPMSHEEFMSFTVSKSEVWEGTTLWTAGYRKDARNGPREVFYAEGSNVVWVGHGASWYASKREAFDALHKVIIVSRWASAKGIRPETRPQVKIDPANLSLASSSAPSALFVEETGSCNSKSRYGPSMYSRDTRDEQIGPPIGNTVQSNWLFPNQDTRFLCRQWEQSGWCSHGQHCRFVHLQKPFGGKLEDLWERIEYDDLQMSHTDFNARTRTKEIDWQGKALWTAGFSEPGKREKRGREVFYAEGSDAVWTGQGASWYASEEDAIKALRKVIVVSRWAAAHGIALT